MESKNKYVSNSLSKTKAVIFLPLNYIERIFIMKNKQRNIYSSSNALEKQNQKPNMKGYHVKRIAFHRKVGKKS